MYKLRAVWQRHRCALPVDATARVAIVLDGTREVDATRVGRGQHGRLEGTPARVGLRRALSVLAAATRATEEESRVG